MACVCRNEIIIKFLKIKEVAERITTGIRPYLEAHLDSLRKTDAPRYCLKATFQLALIMLSPSGTASAKVTKQLVCQSDESQGRGSQVSHIALHTKVGIVSAVILLIKSAEVTDADFCANYDLLKIFIANSIEPDVGIPMLSDFRVSCLLLFFPCKTWTE